jgi:hypothetical protein
MFPGDRLAASWCLHLAATGAFLTNTVDPELTHMLDSFAADHVELRRLAESYAIAVDHGDADGLRALFVPGGALLVYSGDSDAPRHTITDAGFGALVDQLREANLRTFHIVGNVVADVDGDRASGTVYCLASHIRERDGAEQMDTVPVRYTDVYERTSSGWRFAVRRATLLGPQRRRGD